MGDYQAEFVESHNIGDAISQGQQYLVIFPRQNQHLHLLKDFQATVGAFTCLHSHALNLRLTFAFPQCASFEYLRSDLLP